MNYREKIKELGFDATFQRTFHGGHYNHEVRLWQYGVDKHKLCRQSAEPRFEDEMMAEAYQILVGKCQTATDETPMK